jgi:hypothetical protein
LNLGIEPVHYDFLSCMEDSIVGVAEWANYNYELIFSEDWYFVFNHKINHNLGSSFGIFNKDIVRRLDKYHGIKIISKKVSSQKLIGIIKRELKKKQPIMVSMDSYLCPWDWNFQKKHFHHYFLIIGIDHDECFHCCDRFFKTNGIITQKNLIEGFLGDYKIFRFKNKEKTHVKWGQILAQTINKLKNEAGKLNAFDSMRSFADSLESLTDLQNEIQGHEDFLFMAPLIKNLEDITYGRRRFAKLLKYFANETGLTDLNEISNSLVIAASQWANIRTMLIKYAFQDDIADKNQAVMKIREVATWEEAVADRVCQIYQKNTPTAGYFSNRTIISNELSKKNITPINSRVSFIDLSPYLNNKAFGETISTDCQANLMVTGTYFLKENLPGNQNDVWKIQRMKFRLPWLYGTDKDNISCNGQKIAVVPGIYQNIMILGCAEWGNYTDKLTLHSVDGQIEELVIKMTDCLYEPLYGETIAWKGRAVEKIDGRPQLRGGQVYIGAQKYPATLKGKIKFVQLPEVPGIHIFAITLA